MNHPPATTATVDGEVIALLAALSNPSIKCHQDALRARDSALSQSNESYTLTILNFGRVLACEGIHLIPKEAVSKLQSMDPTSYMQLEHDPTLWRRYREMAGLLLKNALIKPPLLQQQLQQHRYGPGERARLIMVESFDANAELKHVFLKCITDSEVAVRNVAGTCIAAIISNPNLAKGNVLSLDQWPEMLSFMTSCLKGEQNGDNGVNGAFNALVKLCEDNPSALDSETLGRPLNTFIPIFLQYFKAPDEKHRKLALQCMNFLIELMPAALIVNMNDFLSGLSELANDSNSTVRQYVCRSIVSL